MSAESEKGEALAFLVHVLQHGWRWALEEVLTETSWTCRSCDVVFRPTVMMLLQDHDNFRDCPRCEGLWWGAFRTNTPSWFKLLPRVPSARCVNGRLYFSEAAIAELREKEKAWEAGDS